MPGEYFDARFEQESIDKGITDQQGEQGTTVPWFFFDPKDSHPDPIYGEGGRKWDGPYPMPVFSITRSTGGRNDQEGEGLYPVDSVVVWLGYGQAEKAGLLPVVDETHEHLKDRFVFDNEVWSPSSIVARNWLGQGARRSMIVVTGTQVMPDEMDNDPDFLARAAEPFRQPDAGFDVA
jgi:hypothetical protein